MSSTFLDPRCERPSDLVRPVRLDPTGRAGPTRGQARSRAWERVAHGWYAPADRRRSIEQRILDAGCRLPADGSRGLVTGWAALRWRGARFLDGHDDAGEEEAPVELIRHEAGASSYAAPGTIVGHRWVSPDEREVVDGLAVATVHRALFDEIARRGSLWRAVTAIDMVAAAELTSVWRFATYVDAACHAVAGVPLARAACAHAVDESRSPRETWLRLVWTLEAGLPEPLVNAPVYDDSGRFLAKPDLLDVAAGLAIEYDGEVHLTTSGRRRDVERERRLRESGLDYLTVVRGQSRAEVADALRAARSRALQTPRERR